MWPTIRPESCLPLVQFEVENSWLFAGEVDTNGFDAIS